MIYKLPAFKITKRLILSLLILATFVPLVLNNNNSYRIDILAQSNSNPSIENQVNSSGVQTDTNTTEPQSPVNSSDEISYPSIDGSDSYGTGSLPLSPTYATSVATLQNQIAQRKIELEAINSNYNKLLEASEEDFSYASAEYGKLPKSINQDSASIDEMRALVALTMARYAALNSKLYQSRIKLEENLDLLDQSGFDRERVKNHLDSLYRRIISNQANLAAFEYVIYTTPENPELAKDYKNYLFELINNQNNFYKIVLSELQKIIKTSLL